MRKRIPEWSEIDLPVYRLIFPVERTTVLCLCTEGGEDTYRNAAQRPKFTG